MQKFSLCLFALFPVVNQLLKRKWDAAWVIEPRCNASAQAFYSNNTRMTQLLDGYHRSSNKRPSNFSVRFPIALFAIRDAEVYTGLIVLQLIGVLISNNQTNDIQREKRRRTGPSDILRRYVECGTLSSSSNMAYRTILHLDSEIKKKKWSGLSIWLHWYEIKMSFFHLILASWCQGTIIEIEKFLFGLRSICRHIVTSWCYGTSLKWLEKLNSDKSSAWQKLCALPGQFWGNQL